MNKKVIVIVGPTAVGKTDFAISVAKQHGTEIISADSRQCYRELNIGVARPSPEQLAEVPHHFIASHSIHDEITAADFEAYALSKVEEIFTTHDVVVMTGGTGLYVKAFCEGLDNIPDIPTSIRTSIIDNYEKEGINWLQQELRKKDPSFANVGEMQNPQRMMRALEVFESTGKSILEFRTGTKTARNFGIEKVGLELPRDVLNKRINKRVDEMMYAGLEAEAKSLYEYSHLNALQTVGYKELFDHFEGLISIEEAVEGIKMNTRRYAKRQMTWFKKDPEITWQCLII